MLKSIELINFESHEHTVISDIPEGFTLIWGDSDAGKTSIVRALKLAAYNIFDQKSVRVGKKFCEVKVTSDKGVVHAKRGKNVNEWIVTPNGKTPLVFDKVGKGVVPAATEVLGLSMVTLGETDIPVNIMDQDESHFLLSELAGKKASGSSRAQIIDEISGLSGIEGLIKSVSLDNHRIGREVTQLTEKINETLDQMHDKDEILKEKSVLTSVKNLIDQKKTLECAVDICNDLLSRSTRNKELMSSIGDQIDSIPDTESANNHLESIGGSVSKIASANSIMDSYSSQKETVKGMLENMDKIPDVDQVIGLIDGLQSKILTHDRMESIISRHNSEKDQVGSISDKIEKEIPDCDSVEDITTNIQSMLDKLDKCLQINDLNLQNKSNLLESKEKLSEVDKHLLEAQNEESKAMSEVTVCPLTLRPVSGDCLKASKGDD